MQSRGAYLVAVLVFTTCWMISQSAPAQAQQPPARPASAPAGGEERRSFPEAPPALAKLLEAKVTAEWEAIKARDKNAFSKLLTDDFIAVESDGDGARNRIKAANELADSFLKDFHLQLLKTYALAPGLAYVRYENTMEFPPKSALRYKRLWIGEIWVKQGDDWKLWRYQETPVK